MIWIIILSILTLIILYFFSSYASPIPYFPTNKKDINMIVQAMKLANDQVVIDLGAGDGAVIWAGANEAHKKNLTTQFVAVDINMILVLWMKLRRLLHPHKAYITILHGDMFLIDYQTIIRNKKPLFYIYITPWLTKQVYEMIIKMKIRCNILSYFYPITGAKYAKKASGIHNLYFYTIR